MFQSQFLRITSLAASICAMLLSNVPTAQACTGVTLRAKDGAVIYGRTMEWGTFDLNSRLLVIPRGYRFTGRTPDGRPGLAWTTKFGTVGLDALGEDVLVDGMNEKGLTVGLFYHPGFAVYPKYDPAKAGKSLGPTDVGQYLLTTCETVDQVRDAMQKVVVTPVVEPALGFAPPVHFMATDASGKSIVIEFLKGEMKIFDAPLGVITNAPSYDWHEINLRNYVNLSPVAVPDRKWSTFDFKPLGGGSGMIGLPGDFTPPSRFVRAVAFSKTARPTPTGDETMYELFRILDNFDVPLGASEGGGADKTKGMRSSTLWTSGYDTKSRVMYYHTQNNRRVREVDVAKIDFSKPTKLIHQALDKVKKQDIENVTPRVQ